MTAAPANVSVFPRTVSEMFLFHESQPFYNHLSDFSPASHLFTTQQINFTEKTESPNINIV